MAPKLSPDEARQGEKTGHLRYILGLSLGAVVIIFVVLLLFFM